MTQRWRRFIAWADEYYDRDWRAVWFQPILCLFIFGVSARLALLDLDPPPFKQVLQVDLYETWLTLGMLCPVLVAVSWALIRQGGRAGVMGRSLRFGADVGLFTVLLAYHIVSVKMGTRTEALIFTRYVLAAVMIFVLEVILRDLWAIRLAERRFRVLKHGG